MSEYINLAVPFFSQRENTYWLENNYEKRKLFLYITLLRLAVVFDRKNVYKFIGDMEFEEEKNEKIFFYTIRNFIF